MRSNWQAIAGIAAFSAAILSASGAGFGVGTVFILLQSAIYLGAIVVHEGGHYWCGRACGETGRLTWQPHPTVTFESIGYKSAKFVALAGPVVGATFAWGMLGSVVYILPLSPMLYSVPFAIALMHLGMLWPSLPDGQKLFSRQSKVISERTLV